MAHEATDVDAQAGKPLTVSVTAQPFEYGTAVPLIMARDNAPANTDKLA
jgi:hypothetical protein